MPPKPHLRPHQPMPRPRPQMAMPMPRPRPPLGAMGGLLAPDVAPPDQPQPQGILGAQGGPQNGPPLSQMADAANAVLTGGGNGAQDPTQRQQLEQEVQQAIFGALLRSLNVQPQPNQPAFSDQYSTATKPPAFTSPMGPYR